MQSSTSNILSLGLLTSQFFKMIFFLPEPALRVDSLSWPILHGCRHLDSAIFQTPFQVRATGRLWKWSGFVYASYFRFLLHRRWNHLLPYCSYHQIGLPRPPRSDQATLHHRHLRCYWCLGVADGSLDAAGDEMMVESVQRCCPSGDDDESMPSAAAAAWNGGEKGDDVEDGEHPTFHARISRVSLNRCLVGEAGADDVFLLVFKSGSIYK